MNDTDVQATNTDYKPKLHKNYKVVLQIWLVDNNVVVTQEHVALGQIRFCHTVRHGSNKLGYDVCVDCTTRTHIDANATMHITIVE